MRLNEKYKNYFNIMGETGTPSYFYTLWTQLIKSAPQAISTYCPSVLDSSKLTDDDIRALDIYLHTHYGMRNVLNWFGALDVGVSNTESPTQTQQNVRANLARSIFMIYGSKWEILLEILGIYSKIGTEYKYNPIENVFEIIDETVDTDHDGTETLTKSGKEADTVTGSIETAKSGSEKSTRKGTVTEKDTGSENVARSYDSNGLITEKHLNHTIQDDKSAFNDGNAYQADKKQTVSDVAANSFDKDVVKGGYTDAKSFANRQHETSYGTGGLEDELSFNNRKDTQTYNNYKNEKTFDQRVDETLKDLTDSMTRNLQRHGNIGVASSSRMIMEEIETRRFLIFREMCEDLMGYISSPVYSI